MHKNYPIPSREAALRAFTQSTATNRAGRRCRLLFMLAALCGLQLLVPAAQGALKRALFYGPTTDTNMGVAEKFVGCCNIADGGNGFAAIGTGSANSQVWSEATWLNKNTAAFAAFDVIIIGDAPRGTSDRNRWNTAIITRAVWTAAVNGNVLIFGGDPDRHFLDPPPAPQPDGPQRLVQKAVTFGASQTGYSQHATGLYVALSQVEF